MFYYSTATMITRTRYNFTLFYIALLAYLKHF